ncbi:DUF2500 domain-containing protein [Paenibacillus sp. GCM10023248]|uniref:DUF2500 domain-containing protein n=1 Tax=unclassified Paenibacillus TaxID=185978 RepID=UPI00237A026B|nr:DUF2500 domain-containing protein [Paenibacillus sp. MAHUQ-63]MDD9270683.1 DUF2500 domain-containing protein [Paenibacillus sp. MAHUQ-63]
MSTGLNSGPFPTDGTGGLFILIFTILCVLIGGFIIVLIIKSVLQWSANNASPIESLSCKVVARRMHVSGGSGDSSTNTRYYATFEFEDRRRLELRVGRDQFGYIVEGDQGILMYQGTRFKSFTRNLSHLS